MNDVVLQCEALCRVYDDGDKSVTVLRSVDLTLLAGEKIAIVGGSGSGKSTLLNCLVGKLIPDTGSVMFDGQSVLGRAPFEINQMGISRVFQTPEIFGDLTVLENMMIPCFAKRDGSFELNALLAYNTLTLLNELHFHLLIAFLVALNLSQMNAYQQ